MPEDPETPANALGSGGNEALPAYVAWDPLTLPADSDFWVFAYGSLMWNPGFDHEESRLAQLYGFHRRFCIFSFHYRGTAQKPGLVFGLDRGGACRGMAYRIARDKGETVMDYLYKREMISGVYLPRWAPVFVAGQKVLAATFTVNRHHRQYAGRLDDAETLRLIRQGEGVGGRCADYLRNTAAHLDELGLHDTILKRLAKAL